MVRQKASLCDAPNWNAVETAELQNSAYAFSDIMLKKLKKLPEDNKAILRGAFTFKSPADRDTFADLVHGMTYALTMRDKKLNKVAVFRLEGGTDKLIVLLAKGKASADAAQAWCEHVGELTRVEGEITADTPQVPPMRGPADDEEPTGL